MKFQHESSPSGDERALRIVDIPLAHMESVKDAAKDIEIFLVDYLACLELRLEKAESNDMTGAHLVSAQIIKSRAFLDEAKRQLEEVLVDDADFPSAAELGFPEFDEPPYSGPA